MFDSLRKFSFFVERIPKTMLLFTLHSNCDYAIYCPITSKYGAYFEKKNLAVDVPSILFLLQERASSYSIVNCLE